MKTRKLKAKPLFYISEQPIEDLLSGVRMGDILRGRVVRLLPPDKAIVRIRGFNLVAENRSGLKESDRFRAQVERVGPPLALTLLQEATEDPISLRLKEIGFRATQLNRTLAQALLASNLPLNKGEMENFLSLWKRVSALFREEENPHRIRVALLFKKMKTYPSPKMLEALKREDLLIGENIDELNHLSPSLGEALSHLPLQPDDPRLPAKMERLPEEKGKALREISSSLKGLPSKGYPRLRDIIIKMGYIRDLESLSHNSLTYRQIPIREGNKTQTFQLKVEQREPYSVTRLRLLGETKRMGKVEMEALSDGGWVLLRVWTEKEATGPFFGERLAELEKKLKALGLNLYSPFILKRKISLSPLSFLISPWEGNIDLRG